jgi:hypothetical protein
VDLPTYTNIWRIEKRLYKLYDFRLPMPLPVGQIAVFLAIAVPYIGLLAILGLPFSHTLLWLYVLPPGVLAWLTTRPVLESKKLPELVLSQVRYLLEPRTWCRMSPLTEKEEITLTATVWRRAQPAPDLDLAPAAARPARPRPVAQPLALPARATVRQLGPAAATTSAPPAAGQFASAQFAEVAAAGEVAIRPAVPGQSWPVQVEPGLAASGRPAPAEAGSSALGRSARSAPARKRPARPGSVRSALGRSGLGRVAPGRASASRAPADEEVHQRPGFPQPPQKPAAAAPGAAPAPAAAAAQPHTVPFLAQPQPGRPGPGQPQPQSAQSPAAMPQAGRPEAAQPQVDQPRVVQPQVGQPQPARAQPVQPHIVHPTVVQSPVAPPPPGRTLRRPAQQPQAARWEVSPPRPGSASPGRPVPSQPGRSQPGPSQPGPSRPVPAWPGQVQSDAAWPGPVPSSPSAAGQAPSGPSRPGQLPPGSARPGPAHRGQEQAGQAQPGEDGERQVPQRPQWPQHPATSQTGDQIQIVPGPVVPPPIVTPPSSPAPAASGPTPPAAPSGPATPPPAPQPFAPQRATETPPPPISPPQARPPIGIIPPRSGWGSVAAGPPADADPAPAATPAAPSPVPGTPRQPVDETPSAGAVARPPADSETNSPEPAEPPGRAEPAGPARAPTPGVSPAADVATPATPAPGAETPTKIVGRLLTAQGEQSSPDHETRPAQSDPHPSVQPSGKTPGSGVTAEAAEGVQVPLATQPDNSSVEAARSPATPAPLGTAEAAALAEATEAVAVAVATDAAGPAVSAGAAQATESYSPTKAEVAAQPEAEPQPVIGPEVEVKPEAVAQAEAVAPPEAEAQPEAAEVRAGRPVVTVTGEAGSERPMRVVERALRSQSNRPDGWRDRVVVVPGGHRPGKPDQLQRDRARARLPVSGPRRIVVLGCTRGAGQTTTVLLAGDMLASLRDEPVAVLDLNPGRNSLAEQAAAIPGLVADPLDAPRLVEGGAWTQAGGRPGSGGPAGSGGRPGSGGTPSPGSGRPDAGQPGGSGPVTGSGLQVISGNSVPGSGDAGRVIDAVARRYLLTLADPAAGCVPRTLEVADQLMIVAPASAEAANALGMTFEWLDAHGYGRLATGAVTILNGVSGPTAAHAERAANVANGRCRAIVKVPWDSHLKDIARDRMPYRGAAGRGRRAEGAPTLLAAPTEPPSRGAQPTGAPSRGAQPTGAHGAGGQPPGPRATSLLSPALTHAYTALAGVLVAGLTGRGDARSAR